MALGKHSSFMQGRYIFIEGRLFKLELSLVLSTCIQISVFKEKTRPHKAYVSRFARPH